VTVLSPDLRARAEEIKARYPDPRSAMLPLLYLVQSVEGHVSREGLQEVAEILGVTTAEVEAVATFYTMIRLQPTGKWLLSVCTNLSCALVGAKAVYERAEEVLGPAAHAGATDDGLFSLHEEECLGACDQAPVVQINFVNYDRVHEDGVVRLIEALRKDEVPASHDGVEPVDFKATCRILAGLGSSPTNGQLND
jgi:NADH-quinone oxidoreductase subunit E